MRILLAGWFSFEEMGNTAGDMIARDIVCNWLRYASIDFDVAAADSFPYPDGIKWEAVNPSEYSDVLFVCGPFGNGWPVTSLLDRFKKSRLIGVNLTLIESLDQWNPFTFLYERDSSVAAHPDITFYGPLPKVPVVGVIQITKQDEYGKKDLREKAHKSIEHFIQNREMSIVRIDTALANNQGGLRTPGEVEALIARMDVVITTRLHGVVLALKNGVPVIPVDPVEGGAKVSRQVMTVGWPVLLKAEHVNESSLEEAFTYCLTEEARLKAAECTKKAIKQTDDFRKKFIRKLKELSKKS